MKYRKMKKIWAIPFAFTATMIVGAYSVEAEEVDEPLPQETEVESPAPAPVEEVPVPEVKDVIETTTESRDITYKIEYVYEDGTQALDPTVSVFEIEREKNTNQTTGEVTYGEWDMTVVDFMDAPEIEGYKADKNPGSVWFDDTFEDYTVFTVTYNKLPTKTIERVIHFQDENGNTIAEDLVQRIEIEWDGQGTFESVQAPSIRGYTSNQASVDASQVTYDSDNEDIVITYKKEVAKPTILEKIVQRIDCALSTIRNTVWSLYSIFKRWF